MHGALASKSRMHLKILHKIGCVICVAGLQQKGSAVGGTPFLFRLVARRLVRQFDRVADLQPPDVFDAIGFLDLFPHQGIAIFLLGDGP